MLLIVLATSRGGTIALGRGCAAYSSGTSREAHVRDQRKEGAPTSKLQPQATAMPSLMTWTAWHSPAAAYVYASPVPDRRRMSFVWPCDWLGSSRPPPQAASTSISARGGGDEEAETKGREEDEGEG